MTPSRGREPVRALGVAAARRVREAIGYVHPTELEIEVVAHLRGALVRATPVRGARANLVRLGDRGIIGVAAELALEERRWAVAHELGHFEIHAGVTFVDLCASDAMLPSYQTSGREPEANAFAAELLMPGDLFAPRCDPPRLSWEPIRSLAREFGVSLMAAALRFVTFTAERAALVCMKDGVVAWSVATKDFGRRPARRARVAEWTEAHAFFTKGDASSRAESVSASAWIEGAEDDDELMEQVLPMPKLGMAMSLLWWKS